ncbi:hypothetical protein [Acidaminococcus timonensis]|uniref:MotA/TolQ/ExbB proton channel family protein n=1 Tax=Acidaminococcus timonensis TaxID=1871002 RepID=UPI00307F7E48
MNLFAAGIDYFIKGDWVMWPLLVCSIAALAIGVERTLYFRKADSGRGFTKKFCTYIEENNWDTAKHLADTTRGEIAKLATIIMAAMEIMSSWKISSVTGQSGPWTNLNRTCPI